MRSAVAGTGSMMLRSELLELLTHREGSQLEFKLDDVAPKDVAKVMVAFANHEGGRILFGVDDDATVVGVRRTGIEEWLYNIARDKIRPAINPTFDLLRDIGDGRDVVVVSVDPGITVHQRWHNNRGQYYIRTGSESREPSPDELQRLFQRRGTLRAELQPVTAATVDDLDAARLEAYFRDIREQELPPPGIERDRILTTLDLLAEGMTGLRPSCAGMLLFGREPAAFLGQAVIDLIAFAGEEPDYDIIDREEVNRPLVRLDRDGVSDLGAIEHAVRFVSNHMRVATDLADGTRRDVHTSLPIEPIREAVVNAVAHRDYLMEGATVQVRVFSSGMEVVSPGRPPNGITLESMLLGDRSTRNNLIVDVLRDYAYVDRLGMGISRKMVKIMQEFNGTVPEFSLTNETLRVRLRSAV